jgi:hypothetical protein
LIPPYDSDLIDLDPEAEIEFENSKVKFMFNKHGYGFDQHGNEIINVDIDSTTPNLNVEENELNQGHYEHSRDEL